MSNLDKFFWGCVLVAAAGIMAAVIWSDKQSEIFEEKCKAAGGLPSKYQTTVGKTQHSERVCFHPSAIINVE